MTDIEFAPFEFPVTPERIAYRKQWGYGAGQEAHSLNVPRSLNPFTPGPFLPMHDSWLEGWDEGERRRGYDQALSTLRT